MILQAQALSEEGEVLCYDRWRDCHSTDDAESYRERFAHLTQCPVRLVASGAKKWEGPQPLETTDERGNPLFI